MACLTLLLQLLMVRFCCSTTYAWALLPLRPIAATRKRMVGTHPFVRIHTTTTSSRNEEQLPLLTLAATEDDEETNTFLNKRHRIESVLTKARHRTGILNRSYQCEEEEEQQQVLPNMTYSSTPAVGDSNTTANVDPEVGRDTVVTDENKELNSLPMIMTPSIASIQRGPGEGQLGGGGKRVLFAVLVDAENAQYTKLEAIMEEIVSIGGQPSVRRVYGDFTKQELDPWKLTSLNLSFLPVNAFSYVPGKGTSDAAMIIDAMELLFTNPSIGGFALVSSDSDFTRLGQRLREAGKHVIGFGERKTSSPFVTACERFVYTEILETLLQSAREKRP